MKKDQKIPDDDYKTQNKNKTKSTIKKTRKDC